MERKAKNAYPLVVLLHVVICRTREGTLSPIITEVESHPKWKESTLEGRIFHFHDCGRRGNYCWVKDSDIEELTWAASSYGLLTQIPSSLTCLTGWSSGSGLPFDPTTRDLFTKGNNYHSFMFMFQEQTIHEHDETMWNCKICKCHASFRLCLMCHPRFHWSPRLFQVIFSPKMVNKTLQVSQHLPHVFPSPQVIPWVWSPLMEFLASKNIEIVWYDWKTIGFSHPFRPFLTSILFCWQKF